jgi:hypothetical protein
MFESRLQRWIHINESIRYWLESVGSFKTEAESDVCLAFNCRLNWMKLQKLNYQFLSN